MMSLFSIYHVSKIIHEKRLNFILTFDTIRMMIYVKTRRIEIICRDRRNLMTIAIYKYHLILLFFERNKNAVRWLFIFIIMYLGHDISNHLCQLERHVCTNFSKFRLIYILARKRNWWGTQFNDFAESWQCPNQMAVTVNLQ